MNPHFQPQNTSPFPQNPSGYPQTNPYDPQQTNSSPNKYPTLPPVQNHQNPQYPQYPNGPQQNYPPQQYPQYNPSVGGHPGYVPPAQYGNLQHGQAHDERERMRLEMEMKELEERLDSGHLSFYTLWSWVVGVCTFVAFLFIFAGLVSTASGQRSALSLFGIGIIWFCIQSYFAIASKRNKDLTQATVTCWIVCISLIPSLFFEAVFVWLWATAKSSIDREVSLMFSSFATVHLLMHILVNMIGAFTVRSILVKRAEVEMRMVEHSFKCQA